MIPHPLIRTGFDFELQFGGPYFLSIIQAAYDAGLIPQTVDLTPGNPATVQRPHDAYILTDQDEVNLGVSIQVSILSIDLYFNVAFTNSGIDFEFVDFSEESATLLQALLSPAQYTLLLNNLRTTVSQSFPISLGNDIVRVSTIVLEGSADFQDALGVYLNADIQINPQNTSAEEEFIERGDVNLGISYLPFENDYAIGLSSALFNRFANHTWHQMAIDEVPAPFSHHIFDPGEFNSFTEALEDDPDTDMPDPVGVHKSISFFPSFGHLTLIARSQFFIDFWPDADITAEFTVVPDIDEEGNLTFLSELTEFDADTGLLGDFLAFLLGGAVGLIFPPLGGLFAVGAVVALEVGENIAEDEFSDDAEDQVIPRLEDAFTSIPGRYELFRKRDDPFFEVVYFLRHIYDHAEVDVIALSLAGTAGIDAENAPVDTISIVNKTRAGSVSHAGLFSLRYRIDDMEDESGNPIEVDLLIDDVLSRLEDNRIATVSFTPTAVKKDSQDRITDIQFNDEVDFSIMELLFLVVNEVVAIPGYQMIRPRASAAYFRNTPDGNPDNNLDNLPEF